MCGWVLFFLLSLGRLVGLRGVVTVKTKENRKQEVKG